MELRTLKHISLQEAAQINHIFEDILTEAQIRVASSEEREGFHSEDVHYDYDLKYEKESKTLALRFYPDIIECPRDAFEETVYDVMDQELKKIRGQ